MSHWKATSHGSYSQVHSLSNGAYSLLITTTGSGYSHWRNLDLTRWRADLTMDNWGTWFYVRDERTGRLWSATAQPMAVPPDRQEMKFYPHQVEFERQDGYIGIHTKICVAGGDDVEIRRITITNHDNQDYLLSLTSYGEVILSMQEIDRDHPAYNSLFIESEFLEDEQVLLFHRRKRSVKETSVYMAHFVTTQGENAKVINFETDRSRFLGRGGTTRAPAALVASSGLSRTTGITLDPIFALQTQIVLSPYEAVQIAYITVAAASRQEALELALRYRLWKQIRLAFNNAATQAENELVQLGLTLPKLEIIQKLLSALIYPSSALRADPATLASNVLGQADLWSFSVSGNFPILLIQLTDERGFDLLKETLRAHTYWRQHGLTIDLVILNRGDASSKVNLSEQIYRLLSETSSEIWVKKRSGVFVFAEDQLTPSQHALLATVSRAVLESDAGTLYEQLSKLDNQPVRLPQFVPIESRNTLPDIEDTIKRPDNLLYDNGLGGFTPDGREYVIFLEPGNWTPAPWINVIANPRFGFLVSSDGLGCTWSQNSRENRLTPWHNDPICDQPSEAIYIRDEDTGQIWSPTPLPIRAPTPYLIRHGTGYSIFEHASNGLDQNLRVFAVPDKSVKIVQLKLRNRTSRARRVSVTYYAEWVLGRTRETTAPFVVSEFDSERFALMARNPYNVDFANNVAFLACTREPNGITADRAEFLGTLGSYARPAALERVGMTPRVDPGLDPCAAMHVLLWLRPSETKEVTFLLGQGTDRGDAEDLISQFKDINAIDHAWQSVLQFWDELTGRVQVRTPDPAVDFLLNRWLQYQVLSCNVWGRTALYQSSGAFGFRDQLQDVISLLHTQPVLARAHILMAASRQFEAGDVLHWWHPHSGRGVRTRITDDQIWLPYITASYVETTGDYSILSEKVPFLRAEPLREDEDERYGRFGASVQTSTLYDHCLRAIARGITTGSHGLPLMGAGDWNDAMSLVGSEGKGESIWLGWFLISTLNKFAKICNWQGDTEGEDACLHQADLLRGFVEKHGWDGNWYRRAYFDDGTALGTATATECRIESLSQSWAVLSGVAIPGRSLSAMEAVYEHLVRLDDEIILSLSPPFDRTAHDPGYIKGFPPGIRENGGQYTHAALWAVWAFAELGQGDRAASLFQTINPIHRAATPQSAARYRVEPYVAVADVYSVMPHSGRGGWTWYTGSASWMYRLGLEAILGFRREGSKLHMVPSIPKDWAAYEINYRYGNTIYNIHVENPQSLNGNVKHIILDEIQLEGNVIQLMDDGLDHKILVTLGTKDKP